MYVIFVIRAVQHVAIRSKIPVFQDHLLSELKQYRNSSSTVW